MGVVVRLGEVWLLWPACRASAPTFQNMMTRRASVASASILLALAPASCGEDKATPAAANEVAASKAPESPEAPPAHELKEYFEAAWSDDVIKTKQAVEMAAPGSNAEAYAIYLAGTAQAALDAGQAALDTNPVEEVDGGFKQCRKLEDGADKCSEATNIKYVDGKIADFNTGGAPIGDRLVIGNGKAHPLGDLGKARLIAAYRTAEGNLYAVFEVRSKVNGLGINFDTSYVAPNGRQTQNGGATSPSEWRKGALANATILFQGAEFGGTLHLNVFTSTGNYDTASAEFKIT